MLLILAVFAPRFGATLILVFGMIEGVTEQFNPREYLPKRPAKSHLHGSRVLIILRKVGVIDLVRANTLAILLLKKHSVVSPGGILAPVQGETANFQLNLGAQERLLAD
jgi:hypothetical protein